MLSGAIYDVACEQIQMFATMIRASSRVGKIYHYFRCKVQDQLAQVWEISCGRDIVEVITVSLGGNVVIQWHVKSEGH